MKRKNGVLILLMVTLLVLQMGCYGSFNLTRSVHDWNGQVGSDWGNEGVFLLLVIIPVYGITLIADAIVFNSIEFWSGENPISSP